MLKWVDETRSRKKTAGDISDTSSLSSFSSECSSVLADLPISPIAQTRRRMLHRPASLAVSPEQIDIEWKTDASEISPISPITFTKRETPSPTSPNYRHSSFISNRFIQRSISECSTNNPTEVLKISTSPDILQINTAQRPPKSNEKSKLASLWKSLTRRKATTNTHLKKAQSMLDFPSIIPTKDNEIEKLSPVERIVRSPSPTNSISKNSLKNIKKKSETMKSKPFTRNSSASQIDSSRRIFLPNTAQNRFRKFNSPSRDSRNGSLDSTSLSSTDSSPEMKMRHKNIEQEFTNALLRIISMDEGSEPECECNTEGDGDVFCYDSDTIIRKNQQNAEIQAH